LPSRRSTGAGRACPIACLSDRHKGYVRDFSEYDRDLETFMREIVLPDCPPPLFAMGHSTGATVLIRAAHQGRRWFDRMVLTAPLIDLTGFPATPTARIMVRAMRLTGFGSMYVPKGEVGIMESRPFAGNMLTSDPVRYARNAAILEADPDLALGRRPWRGPTPPSAPCGRCASAAIRPIFASRS
jgi:lysophospholipase